MLFTYKVFVVSERTMDLVLHLENNIQHSLQWCGLSGKQLGKIQPSSHLMLPLTAIAVSPGLQVNLLLVMVFICSQIISEILQTMR